MRAFAGGDLIQSADGNVASGAGSGSISVTLPAGVTDSNAGIIAMFAQTPIAPPEQWDIIVNTSDQILAIMCRADLPGGESSWPFSAASGFPSWTWAAGEWGNVAPAPAESTAATGITTAPASISTGSTGTFDTEYVMGVAAFGVSGGGTAGWPSVSYSGGFTETDSVQQGTGNASGDLLLKVARLYGADSDPGPWSCTATFTGDMSSKDGWAVLAVFRAEETAAPPIVMTS